jgi:uncharacterized membrane protein
MVFCHTPQRFRRIVAFAVGGLALTLGLIFEPLIPASPALAATLTTPYPAMTVQAGQTVTVTLSLKDTVSQRYELSVSGTPEGWKVSILGDGRPVQAAMTDPSQALALELQVEVPENAPEGVSTLTVTARAAGSSVSMPISFTVSKSEGGTTTLNADYTSLRGPSSAKYTFSLTLANNTLQSRTYNISASGPENWTLSLKPSGASQETPTVTVDSKGSQSLSLEVKPAPSTEAGTYDLNVTAVGGGETVSIPLQVEITGTYTLKITTPEGNLNAEIKAGDTTKVAFVVTNDGTAPLQNVHLQATAPANWDVTFEPATIDVLPPGQQATVTAAFKPADNAIAGDYVVTVNAQADQATAQSDIRVTVKTSTLWGVIGALIAVAAIAILGFVFRRYGRR